MLWDYEHTDTFAGEANYCWVNRGTVDAPSEREAMRKARAAVGMTGVRGRYESFGDMARWRPYGICHVIFVSWHE